jgi:hypothetical protein
VSLVDLRQRFLDLIDQIAATTGWTVNRPALNIAVFRNLNDVIVLVLRYRPRLGRLVIWRPGRRRARHDVTVDVDVNVLRRHQINQWLPA